MCIFLSNASLNYTKFAFCIIGDSVSHSKRSSHTGGIFIFMLYLCDELICIHNITKHRSSSIRLVKNKHRHIYFYFNLWYTILKTIRIFKQR